jgi:osmotically-inducible protein OsmY
MAVSLSAAQSKPDNTAANKQSPHAATADQQSNRTADLETSRQIRRALIADKSLSTYAHNIKIVTQHGKVTLRGPVRTEAEKQTVRAKAAEVAGADNVTSAVTVMAAAPHKRTTS